MNLCIAKKHQVRKLNIGINIEIVLCEIAFCRYSVRRRGEGEGGWERMLGKGEMKSANDRNVYRCLLLLSPRLRFVRHGQPSASFRCLLRCLDAACEIRISQHTRTYRSARLLHFAELSEHICTHQLLCWISLQHMMRLSNTLSSSFAGCKPFAEMTVLSPSVPAYYHTPSVHAESCSKLVIKPELC